MLVRYFFCEDVSSGVLDLWGNSPFWAEQERYVFVIARLGTEPLSLSLYGPLLCRYSPKLSAGDYMFVLWCWHICWVCEAVFGQGRQVEAEG